MQSCAPPPVQCGNKLRLISIQMHSLDWPSCTCIQTFHLRSPFLPGLWGYSPNFWCFPLWRFDIDFTINFFGKDSRVICAQLWGYSPTLTLGFAKFCCRTYAGLSCKISDTFHTCVRMHPVWNILWHDTWGRSAWFVCGHSYTCGRNGPLFTPAVIKVI